jgi:hypothetical protein
MVRNKQCFLDLIWLTTTLEKVKQGLPSEAIPEMRAIV